MDNFDNKSFIEEIKIRPAIWDVRRDEYNDQYLKKRLWKEVCSALCADYDKLNSNEKEILGVELRARWKNLRDSYVRYLRNTKKEKSEKCIKQYVYAPYLDFLKSVTYARVGLFKPKRKSKIQVTINDSLNDCFMEEELEVCNDKDKKSNSAFLIENQNEKEMNDIEKGRPYIINMFKETSAESVNSVNSCEQNKSVAENGTSGIDDDMDFFRSLIPFVKSLPLCKKISFRADIMKIAKEYADNLEKSGASSLSSNFLTNSSFHQQMYLPVLSLHNINSNKQSIVNLKKNQSNPNLDDDPNTSSSL